MPRKAMSKTRSKSRPKVRAVRRRLQPGAAAVAGLYTNAAIGAAAARIADTFTTGKKLRGKYNKQAKPVTLRANSEGYIAPVSQIIGNFETNLSFNERVHKVMNPPQTILFQSVNKYEAVSGRQGVSGYSVGNTQFNDFFGFMAAGKSDNTGATLGTVDNTAVTNTVTHLYTSVQHTFLNSGNLAAELDIYVYKAIQDIGAAEQAFTPSSAWSYSESINGLSGVGADGSDRIGKKPSDQSAKFYIERYWKLLGKTHVTMKPGESFKHYFRMHYNKPYMRFMLSQDTNGQTKDHSLGFIYVVRGQVVGSSLTTDVSTGDAQISCVRNTKIQYCYAQNIRPRDYVLGNDLVQIAAANQQFINTDTSAQATGYVEDA